MGKGKEDKGRTEGVIKRRNEKRRTPPFPAHFSKVTSPSGMSSWGFGKMQEKLTDTVNPPLAGSPPPSLPFHFGVKSSSALRIYFYIQMLWIAPGKGRPFSQQEELILFDCSLWNLEGKVLQLSFGGLQVKSWPQLNKHSSADLGLTPRHWQRFLSPLHVCVREYSLSNRAWIHTIIFIIWALRRFSHPPHLGFLRKHWIWSERGVS